MHTKWLSDLFAIFLIFFLDELLENLQIYQFGLFCFFIFWRLNISSFYQILDPAEVAISGWLYFFFLNSWGGFVVAQKCDGLCYIFVKLQKEVVVYQLYFIVARDKNGFFQMVYYLSELALFVNFFGHLIKKFPVDILTVI